MIRIFALICAVFLAACAGNSARIPNSVPTSSDLRIAASVSTAMLMDVSLPAYAAAEELSLQDEAGLIRAADGLLWADEPERAVTLILNDHLNTISSATVAPEPWPLEGYPDVTIDIRVSRMLSESDGKFRLAGQYFIGGDGVSFPANAQAFAYEVPLSGGLTGLPGAQAAALLSLAEDIARSMAR